MNRRNRNSGGDRQDWEDLSYGGNAVEEEESRPSRRRRRSSGRKETPAEESWLPEESWNTDRSLPMEDEDYRPSRRRVGGSSTGGSDRDDYENRRNSRRRRSSGSGGFGKALAVLAAVAVVFFGAIALLPEEEPPAEKPIQQAQDKGNEQTPAVTFPRPTQPLEEQPQLPAPTMPDGIPQPRENRYFRGKLNAEEQKVYDTYLYCLENRLPKSSDVFISDYNRLDVIMDYLRWDYVEHFWYREWTNYYQETDGGYTVSLEPVYTCSESEWITQKQLVEAAIQPIVSQLTGASDYDKVMGVYRSLVDLFYYDLGYKGTTLYENFRDNRSVCEGYAKATKYILDRLGVETIYVEGSTEGGDADGHAWNIVRINGVYYQLDTTWGDPVREDGVQVISYAYCLLDDATMGRDHTPDDPSLYPACNSMDAHYYVKQGTYYYVYDRQILTELLRGPIATQEEVSFRFADERSYRQAKTELFDNEVIWKIVKDLGWEGKLESYTSSADDNTYVIKITFNHRKS